MGCAACLRDLHHRQFICFFADISGTIPLIKVLFRDPHDGPRIKVNFQTGGKYLYLFNAFDHICSPRLFDHSLF